MKIDGDDDLSMLLKSQFANHLEGEQCVESKWQDTCLMVVKNRIMNLTS